MHVVSCHGSWYHVDEARLPHLGFTEDDNLQRLGLAGVGAQHRGMQCGNAGAAERKLWRA